MLKKVQKSFALIIYLFLAILLFFCFKFFSESPFMSDDFSHLPSGMIDRIDLREPGYARGVLWDYLLAFLFNGIKNSYIIHIIIMLFHTLDAFLFLCLTKKIFRVEIKSVHAAIFIIFYLVNPLSLESLLWITGSYPVFTLFFGLSAIWFLIRYYESLRNVFLIAFILLSSCAYFMNEQGFLIYPIYGLTFLFLSKDKPISFRMATSIKITFAWIAPYILYRIFLYVLFGLTTATQQYNRNYGLTSVLSSYVKMIKMLTDSIPVLLYVILFSTLIVFLLLKTVNKEFDSLTKLSFVIGSAVCILLILLAPFSLLSGWVELRFLYISSCFCLYFIFIGFLYMYKYVKVRWNKIGIVTGLWILVIGILNANNYYRDTLLPINDLHRYVATFIELQNKEYKKLPENTLIFLDILQPRGYIFPKNFKGIYTIKLAWVPAGIKNAGLIPKNATTFLAKGHTIVKNTIQTPYASWNVELKDIEKIIRSNPAVYFYTYDGVELKSIQRSVLAITDNGKDLKRIPLTSNSEKGLSLVSVDPDIQTTEFGEISTDVIDNGLSYEVYNQEVRGQDFIFAHANSTLTYKLKGSFSRFTFSAGLDKTSTKGSVVYQVFGDNKLLYKSEVVNVSSQLTDISVDISNVNELKLQITDAGDGNQYDQAFWIKPIVLK